MTVMSAVKKLGIERGELLRQANSGDTAGPKNQVVGYAAAAFYSGGTEAGANNSTWEKKSSGLLDHESRQELLSIARRAIEETIRTGQTPEPASSNPSLQKLQGAFVTITIGDQLRGCIGNFHARDPLYRTVSNMAVAAARQDPRFPPLSKDELPKIHLEISALTPLHPISDINEIDVGRHGLYIVKGTRSGVLLPQVATEYGWDRMTFLQQTCRKAGLGPDEWREEATIYVFEADVFGEEAGG